MDDLNRLNAFIAVAECGGFTAAALRLGTSKARVSLDVQRLELALGTALFNRTTRRVRLTDAGERLLAEAGPLLSSLQDAMARAHHGAGELRGTLRIAASVAHAAQHLAALVAAFSEKHPALRITLHAGDRVSDMLAEGIDLSFRLGWLRDSSLRAVTLGEFSQVVVAAPTYLAAAGAPPRKPEDLADHAWVGLSLLPTPLTWAFTARNGHTRVVRMAGRLQTDSPVALRALLLQGAGVSVLEHMTVQADLARGTLVQLLPEWQLPSVGLYAVYPPGRHLSAAARAFVDFYRAR